MPVNFGDYKWVKQGGGKDNYQEALHARKGVMKSSEKSSDFLNSTMGFKSPAGWQATGLVRHVSPKGQYKYLNHPAWGTISNADRNKVSTYLGLEHSKGLDPLHKYQATLPKSKQPKAPVYRTLKSYKDVKNIPSGPVNPKYRGA